MNLTENEIDQIAAAVALKLEPLLKKTRKPRKPSKEYSSKLSRIDWESVDWRKTNNKIAAELGLSTQSVRQRRIHLGKPKSDKSFRNHKRLIPEDWIAEADWLYETDVFLARRWHCSRERVRQIRQARGFPVCKIKNTSLNGVEFYRWADQNKAALEPLGYAAILEQSPPGMSRSWKIRTLQDLGYRRTHPNQVHPVDQMNWALPNLILELIWRTPYNYVAQMRSRQVRPKHKFGISGFSWIHNHPDFLAAIQAEIEKAKSLGVEPDEAAIQAWRERRAAYMTQKKKLQPQPVLV